MRTLRILGYLVDFIVGSLIWTVVIALAAIAAPFVLVGFFVWQIFYNTDRFFHVWLPFTPTGIRMMLADPVGRWLVGIPLAIIGWWIVSRWFRSGIRRSWQSKGQQNKGQ
jgi:hypothetical protein